MRIVSDFHDYYDAVQAAGQDQALVYLRKKREVELSRGDYPFPLFAESPWGFGGFRVRDGLSVVQYVIGFCGNVYPVLRLSHRRPSEPSPTSALCYTLSDVDGFVEQRFKRRDIEVYRSRPRRWRFADSRWPRGQRREKFEEYFDACAARQSAFGQLFLDNQCPIFVASARWDDGSPRPECKIVFNDCLKELEFFRLVDTYTAYQELAMYLGGMAQPNKPIPDISDKDMVSIKGFDQWSFRKPPKALG